MYLFRHLCTVTFLSLFLCFSTSPAKAADSIPAPQQWFDRAFVHIYVSQMANMDMGDYLYAQHNLTKVMRDYMVTVGLGAEKNIWGGFALGVEANASLHWGQERDMGAFGEFSAALFLRYYFPWSKTYLPSVTFGDGFSYTTIIPEYETRFGTGDLERPMDSHWLNFLFVELELLRVQDVSLFYRVHHRCTIFGLVGSDLPGGINFHSVGLRYTF